MLRLLRAVLVVLFAAVAAVAVPRFTPPEIALVVRWEQPVDIVSLLAPADGQPGSSAGAISVATARGFVRLEPHDGRITASGIRAGVTALSAYGYINQPLDAPSWVVVPWSPGGRPSIVPRRGLPRVYGPLLAQFAPGRVVVARVADPTAELFELRWEGIAAVADVAAETGFVGAIVATINGDVSWLVAPDIGPTRRGRDSSGAEPIVGVAFLDVPEGGAPRALVVRGLRPQVIEIVALPGAGEGGDAGPSPALEVVTAWNVPAEIVRRSPLSIVEGPDNRVFLTLSGALVVLDRSDFDATFIAADADAELRAVAATPLGPMVGVDTPRAAELMVLPRGEGPPVRYRFDRAQVRAAWRDVILLESADTLIALEARS